MAATTVPAEIGGSSKVRKGCMQCVSGGTGVANEGRLWMARRSQNPCPYSCAALPNAVCPLVLSSTDVCGPRRTVTPR